MKLANLTTSALIIGSILLSTGIAAAQSIGMNGNYIGAGIAAGLTDGGHNNDEAVFGGNVQARVTIPQTPVSVRGAVLFGGDAVSLIPTLTYDLPIAENTNLYLGGGYSFITEEGKNSQLGNQGAAVVTLGAESALNKDVVVYGDAKWAIDAYEDSNADAVSLQAGVGFRF